MVVNIARNFPQFEPFAMLGGLLWATGNMMTVPIIKMIGLSLGMLVWGLTNLLLGWSCGTFGILGQSKGTVSVPALNYVGVIVCVASLVVYLFVKSEVGETKNESTVESESEGLINGNPEDSVPKKEESSWADKLSMTQRRIIGLVGSVISGVFYGLNFNPPLYLMGKEGHSTNSLDYVFSHFTGIWITSTFYFLVYCAIKKNKPDLYPQVVLPGILSGILWAIADISWFVANESLLVVVAFPIITTGPGVVASIWGIVAFREIKGKRNLGVLFLAFGLSVTGVILIALSKAL